MEHPRSILQAARRAEAEHPDNIPAAIDRAVELIRQTGEFQEWCALLIRGMAQQLVYDARCRANRHLQSPPPRPVPEPAPEQAEGRPGQRQRPRPRRRINMSESEGIRNVYRRYFELRIGSKVLGQLRGGELIPLAQQLESQANGVMSKVRLLRRLDPLVPVGQCVLDSVPGPQLLTMMQELGVAA